MKSVTLLVVLFAMIIGSAMAYDIGVSAHPFTLQSQVINTEIDYAASNGTGTGVGVRYFRRFSSNINFDAGLGVNSGERENRIFTGLDYQIFPDYGNQPRISVKGLYSYSTEFEQNVHRIGFAPVISKGLNVYGEEVFPFVSLPLQIGLNSDSNKYQTINTLAFGATAKLPVNGYDKLLVNFETQINFRNSFNAVSLGISLPIN